MTLLYMARYKLAPLEPGGYSCVVHWQTSIEHKADIISPPPIDESGEPERKVLGQDPRFWRDHFSRFN